MLIWSIILIACIAGADRFQVREKEIVQVSVDETLIAPGKKGVIMIRVKVKDGYHIQANKVNDESLIPVTLQVSRNQTFRTSEPVFPPYKLFRLEGTENDLNVFDSVFVIRLPVNTGVSTKEGRYFLKAQLHYQACDARTCLFPRRVEVALPVVVQVK